MVPTEANRGLATMLPVVPAEVRKVLGDRRVTVVFDRGGWSPKLFAQLLADQFDVLTYRKAPWRRVPVGRFETTRVMIDGTEMEYRLADQCIRLEYGPSRKRKRLCLRQVTRLSDDGHQTPILTSRRDLSAIEVAYRMFDRWRQENFFKYLREEFSLDALVDSGTVPEDATRNVPNPERSKLVAYQAEGDLLRRLSPHYRRTDQEGRTLIQSALSAIGDLEVTGTELLVSIDPLSSPHKSAALAAVCEELNATATRFPGTKLRLRFAIKPEPPRSPAFPGARNPSGGTQPDISEGG